MATPFASLVPGLLRDAPAPAAHPLARPAWQRESSVTAALRAGQTLQLTAPDRRVPHAAAGPDPRAGRLARFSDLRRHFVFEYYPWYGTEPWFHWDAPDRVPPLDVSSQYMPRLGAYDSRSRAVLEQHARWIADSGVGTLNVSWWGRDSFEDRALPLVMDVMRDHDLKVTIHLEPYGDDHGRTFASDVLYLLDAFGERRRYDALLLLRDAFGSVGPVFKGFRTIVTRDYVDCHGVRHDVGDYTSDDEWLRQLDGLRRTLSRDFDQVTILADSLDMIRASRSGFDGVAIYDNFVEPGTYPRHARDASGYGLLFSLNVNPGFDSIVPRVIEPDSCFSAPPYAPPADPPIDWARADELERAAALSTDRIRASFDATLAAQLDPALTNDRRGFFLVYLTSFNEWHEGHALEPMKDAGELSAGERAFAYRNPRDGSYRLAEVTRLMKSVQSQVETPARARA